MDKQPIPEPNSLTQIVAKTVEKKAGVNGPYAQQKKKWSEMYYLQLKATSQILYGSTATEKCSK